MTEPTYVHGEIEVKKTGRTAEKQVPGGRPGRQTKMVLAEITPADPNDGTWKKWVNPTTLFEIAPPGEPE